MASSNPLLVYLVGSAVETSSTTRAVGISISSATAAGVATAAAGTVLCTTTTAITAIGSKG